MIKTVISKYLGSFLTLLYPKLCLVCGSSLLGNEEILCTYCRHSLPLTNFHKTTGNPVEQLFWGRLPVERATALLYFDKGSSYNELIHQLKYRGRKDAGIFLGKLLGSAFEDSRNFSPDCIIPVPLHRTKFRRRGYNQSQIIAEGIADKMHIPVYNDVLKRMVYTNTQTRLKRYDRWKNVEGIFKCLNQQKIINKHILLVDDVITTGATMEAAGSILNSVEGIRLSVAAVTFSHI